MACNGLTNGHGHLIADVVDTDGDLPTSTLAAQLVNNLTRGKQHSNLQDRADFESLLQIFESEGKERQYVEITEDIEGSAKLIDVLVKAGLDALWRDNPFDSRDILLRQASRALTVIGMTFRECSEVIYFQSGRPEVDPKLCAPLYIWLLPKLLAIAGNEHFEQLRKGIAAVVHSIIYVEQKIRSKGERLHQAFRYLQGCVNGTASAHII